MLSVPLSVWRTNPELYPGVKIELISKKLGSSPLYIRATEVSKFILSCGYKPKITRELFETQLCRVIVQGGSALGLESHEKFPCQELLLSVIDQKCERIDQCKMDGKKCSKCKRRDLRCKQNRPDGSHAKCPVICPLCPVVLGSEVYGTRFAYAGHIQAKHNISPDWVSFGDFPCTCCGFNFADVKALKVHKRKMAAKTVVGDFPPTISSGTKGCHLCGKKFVANAKLQKHVTLHANEYPISEYISEDQRRSLITLKYQKNNMMSNTHRFLCDECDHSYINACNLRKHKKSVHWVMVDPINKKYSGVLGKSVDYKGAFAYNLLKKKEHADNLRNIEEAVDDVEETDLHGDEEENGDGKPKLISHQFKSIPPPEKLSGPPRQEKQEQKNNLNSSFLFGNFAI